MIYDIKLDKKVDLLKELNIDGYISVFAYKSNKIIAVIGHSEKDKKTGGIISKTDTDRLVEINLKNGAYRFIKLPFIPYGISAYQGIDFYNEGYLLCQSGYQNDKNLNQSIVIVDNSGNVVNVLPLYDEKVIYSIKVSPDNRFISYQSGQTQTDLNIYDIKKNKKTNIHDSTKEKSGFCFYDSWSNDGNTLYYILAIDEVDKQNKSVTNYYINKFDTKSMTVEYSKQIPCE